MKRCTMSSDISPLLTNGKTFRSSSGDLWIISDEQIAKIPYLTALVSSGECFKSIRDEHGFYKLDSFIQSEEFSFVLKSLSFQSVRQIFTKLPMKNDILQIITLFDFLGIAPQPDPTFQEIDTIFFSNILYKPSTNTYTPIIRPYDIQDMAVRFAFALAKGEYDLNNNDVLDQIYWFVMFIQSAYELFGPRLRHHVYRIAEHCFMVFKPTLLKPLRELLRHTEKGIITVLTSIEEDLCVYEEEEEIMVNENMHLNYIERPMIMDKVEPERPSSFFWRWSSSRYFHPWWQLLPNEEDFLKPIRRVVLDTMYEGLQHELCKSLMTVVRQTQLRSTKKQIYKSILQNILTHQSVQDEINKKITVELRRLKPKIESKHNELVLKLREYEQRLQSENARTDDQYFYLWYYPVITDFEQCQNETLVYELLLEKLEQSIPMIVDQLRTDITTGIHKTAQKQIKHWEKTYKEITEFA